MKVFLIQVGDPVKDIHSERENDLILRKSLNQGRFLHYFKKDIINADEQMQSLIASGVEIVYGYLEGRKNLLQLWIAGQKIYKVSTQPDIDLVHAMWGATTGLIAILFSRKPVVISFCGSDLIGNYDNNGKKTLSGQFSRILSLFSALFADHIIVKSEYLKSKLWLLHQHKISIIPNGIEINKWKILDRAICRKRLNWNENEKVVLFFNGSGASVKNWKFAEKVFDIVTQKEAGVRLEIVENVPHEELFLYYNGADVMLLCSLHEGSNNSMKEAMACNLPIVSSNVGDATERLGPVKNCYVLNGWDAEKYAQAIIEILIKQERSNGRQYIEAISLEAVAEKLKAVYSNVIL